MGNILGNPFDSLVKGQIEARQKSLGKYSGLEPTHLQYYNTKTAWLRLASSVDLKDKTNDGKDIEGSVLEKMSNVFQRSEIENDNLAKKFILQGGVTSFDEPGPKSGLNLSDRTFEGAYGWGGVKERGLVPPPGITNVDIQHLNNGALTKTTINIKCFSRKQFQLLDVLYLRPGYTLLLEYGWSVYLDNDGKLKHMDAFKTEPLEKLLGGSGINQYEMYNTIDKEEKKHFYNYGAVFGKVSKFKWQFNSDGSYECMIQLTSMGDIIETLKMNVVSSPVSISIPLPEGVEGPLQQTAPSQHPTALQQEMFQIKTFLAKDQGNEKMHSTDYEMKDWLEMNSEGKFESVDVTVNKGILTATNTVGEHVGHTPNVYITLGVLLLFIESRLLLYDTNNTPKTPITRFDVNFKNLDEDENFIYMFPGQFSADPRICLVPYEKPKLETVDLNYGEIIDFPINEELKKGAKWKKEGTDYMRRLTSIYVNVNYISNVINDTPKDEDGSLPLLKFLNITLDGITNSLGGVNKIRIQISHNNLIKFFEDIPQNDKEVSPEEYAKFKVFGVHKQEGGSFIKETSLVSELSNNLTTQIVIGSQVNSNLPHENATAFSNYNAGLQDRIIPIKDSYKDKNILGQDLLTNQFNKNIEPNKNTSAFSDVYEKFQFTSTNIAYLISHNIEYAKLITGELVKNKKIKAPFFLPFNLNLTMEGLSGMVLYQKFKISDDILPISYENDQIDLIVRGINHNIDANGWTTKIDSLSTPVFKDNTPSTPPIVPTDPPPPETPLDPEEPTDCSNPQVFDFTVVQHGDGARQAMKYSFDEVFRVYGTGASMCARWVYGLGHYYSKALKTQSPEVVKITGMGNARDDVFGSNLTSNSFYNRKILARNVDMDTLKDIIFKNNDNFNYGDILVYYANDSAPRAGDGNDNPYKYGHTQIKVKDLSPSGWACDKKNNHGGSFIYGSRGQKCWDLVYYASPKPL